MWDSGVSRDEPLGSASLNLEMALENSIQVHLGRGGAARDLLIYLGSASLEMSMENSIQVRSWGETWGVLSYRGAIVCLHYIVFGPLTPPASRPSSPICSPLHTGPLVAAGGRGDGRGARNVVGGLPH